MSRAHHETAAGPENQPVSTRRLEAFTDGVFAIAATILVLDLSADGLGAIHSDADMWRALASVSPTLLSVVISFALLGFFWIVHVRQFEFIAGVDSPLLWLNIARLLGVVLVPFSTSVNNDYDQFLAGRIILPVNFLFILAMSAWQWFYATRSKRSLVTRISPAGVHNTRVGSLAAMLVGVGVAILAAFFGPIGFTLFFVLPLIDRVLRRTGVIRDVPAPPADGGEGAVA